MRKRKLWWLSLLCCGVFGVATSVSFAAAENSLENSVKIEDTIAAEYGLGEKLALSGGKITVDGQTYTLQTTLVYPSGAKTSYKEAILREVGEYTLQYFYQVGDEKIIVTTKTFQTVITPTNYFRTTGEASLQANVDSKSYALDKRNGVEVTFQNPTDTAVWATPIDVSDNTKKDTLFELIVSPELEGIAEMTGYTVRLTDSQNPDIWINLYFEAAAWGYEQNSMLHISTNTTEGITYGNSWTYGPQDGVDIYNPNSFTHIGRCGVYGKINNCPVMITRIYYDAVENAIYAKTYHDYKLDGFLTMLVDLDDPAIVSDAFVWNGFPSGKANLQVQADVTQTAHILFYKVDDTTLSGNKISADQYTTAIDVKTPETAFNGVVGAEYPVFEASASDNYGNVYQNLDVSVYAINEANGKKTYRYFPVKNGYFETPVAGEYTVEYSFTDYYGEKRVKTITVTVEEANGEISYVGNPQMQTAYQTSEIISLYEGEVQGAIGEYSVQKEILFYEDGAQTPQTVQAENYGMQDFIRFEKSGRCEIRYTVTDSLNREFEGVVYEFAVNKPTGVTANTPSLPKAVFVGETFVLPSLTAYDYQSGEKSAAVIKTFVNGTDVSDTMAYAVQTTDALTVSYQTASGVVLFEGVVQVAEKISEAYCENFFVYENMTAGCVVNADESVSYMLTTIGRGNGTASFIRKVSVSDLSLSLTTILNKSNCDNIVVTFTDSVNADETVKFTLKKGTMGSKSVCELYINEQVGAKRDGVMAGSLDGSSTDPVKLKYVPDELAVEDYAGDIVAVIQSYANGDKFNGFTSGFAYIDVEFVNAASDFEIVYTSIGNQAFTNAPADTTGPSINFGNDTMMKVVEYGSTVVLKKPSVADVYSQNVTLNVTVVVTKTNGERVTVYNGEALDEMPLVINEYGIYVITWMASDGRNTLPIRQSIEILDTDAPTLTLKEKPKTSYSVGETVYFPIATVKDGGNYVISIEQITSGKCFTAKKTESGDFTFTFRGSGNYRIVYIAFDENMNRTEYEFNVVVK